MTIVIWRSLRNYVPANAAFATFRTRHILHSAFVSYIWVNIKLSVVWKPHCSDVVLIITVLLYFNALACVLVFVYIKKIACIGAFNTRFSFVAFLIRTFINKYKYLDYHLCLHLLSYWLNHLNWRIPKDTQQMNQLYNMTQYESIISIASASRLIWSKTKKNSTNWFEYIVRSMHVIRILYTNSSWIEQNHEINNK